MIKIEREEGWMPQNYAVVCCCLVRSLYALCSQFIRKDAGMMMFKKKKVLLLTIMLLSFILILLLWYNSIEWVKWSYVWWWWYFSGKLHPILHHISYILFPANSRELSTKQDVDLFKNGTLGFRWEEGRKNSRATVFSSLNWVTREILHHICYKWCKIGRENPS